MSNKVIIGIVVVLVVVLAVWFYMQNGTAPTTDEMPNATSTTDGSMASSTDAMTAASGTTVSVSGTVQY